VIYSQQKVEFTIEHTVHSTVYLTVCMRDIFCRILCKSVPFLFVCNFCTEAAEIFMHFLVLLKTYSASPVIHPLHLATDVHPSSDWTVHVFHTSLSSALRHMSSRVLSITLISLQSLHARRSMDNLDFVFHRRYSAVPLCSSVVFHALHITKATKSSLLTISFHTSFPIFDTCITSIICDVLLD